MACTMSPISGIGGQIMRLIDADLLAEEIESF